MLSILANSSAALLYLLASVYLFIRTSQEKPGISRGLISAVTAALIAHSIGVYCEIFNDGRIDLSLLHVASLIFLVINSLVLVSGLRKPLHTLFLFLLPISSLLVLGSGLSHNHSQLIIDQPLTMVSHILLSILAYSLFIMATLHSLLLSFQNYQLKHKHPTGLVRLLPPLQTMESLFFEMLWVGEICLLMAIVSGFLFIDDLFAQHLVHKTVFSLLALVIYGVLLWGRHQRGWRGTKAIRWALGGFCTLMLAYFGSKFVLEIVLGISPGA